MFDNTWRTRTRRRGVVLILILGMLGLMALIGVTFATFAGQSLINNRNYAQSINLPSNEQLMDYALSQLINDTNNPLSSLRGHSLLRDMYGNDSVMGNAGAIRAYLERLPDGTALAISGIGAYPTLSVSNTPLPTPAVNLLGYYQVQTNIPTHSGWPQLYNLDFTRWILRLNPLGSPVAQTIEVLHDDVSGPYHVLTLAPGLTTGLNTSDSLNNDVGIPGDRQTRTYSNPNNQTIFATGATPAPNSGPAKSLIQLTQPTALGSLPLGSQIALDGRHMRAFNGPGMSHANTAGMPDATYMGTGQPHNSAAFGNFRTNGLLLAWPFLANINNNSNNLPVAPTLGDPDQIGMDEDYDACDLENWFLAIQSADGQVMIPSFHRPGILSASYDASGNILTSDWRWSLNSSNLLERQRAVMAVSKILRPRRVDHTANFPADPETPDPVTGQMKYDVDNDGDGVTDSVWLDLGYPVTKDSRGKLFKPLFAFMVIGLNGRLPLNTVGNLQSRDLERAKLPLMDANGNLLVAYPDRPTFSHTSHLGFSVNEINPMFALQNACDAVVTNNTTAPSTPGMWYSQYDNPVNTTGFNVDVATTQLRNLLAGTIPQSQLSPTQGVNYQDLYNQEHNWALVQGSPFYMPNGLADPNDIGFALPVSAVTRTNTAIPGRWGEPEGIPVVLAASSLMGYLNGNINTPPIISAPVHAYENRVRAGRSFLNSAGNSTDAYDDDFDATDFLAVPPMGTANDTGGNPYAAAPASNNERWNYYDNSGSLVLPVERIRGYVSPIDPVGVGRVVKWDDRVQHPYDFGLGGDNTGRVNQFRFFRPAGMAPQIAYDVDAAHTFPAPLLDTERYNQPILSLPPAAPNTPGGGDRARNLYNGYWSRLFPRAGIGGGGDAGIAVSAAVPFNYFYDPATPANSQLYAPNGAAGSNAIAFQKAPNSYASMSIGVNTGQGPYLGPGNASTNPAASVINAYPNYPAFTPASVANNSPVPNVGASLNKDEADEMDLYGGVVSTADMPFGPSDLEWLYRKQDVDGSSLDSRLAKLAPISFLNPADGQTRRRLFSTDAWDTINFSYAFDNPNNAFPYNSRFAYYSPGASAPTQPIPGSSLAAMGIPVYQNAASIYAQANPVLFSPVANSMGNQSIPQNTASVPLPVNPALTLQFTPAQLNTYLNNNGFRPVLTPSVAHRDRKVNLNFPLPVSNDPAEPVRQKWIRETYQLLKSILPPQAVDTPYELAQLSQFVVNIVDFRDTDCSTTRFVNTDVQVIAATSTAPSQLIFATDPVPDANNNKSVGHFPYDPTIWSDTNYTTTLTNQFLTQHGMEYSPIAITEVLAYQYNRKNPSTNESIQQQRLYIELVNTLTDDGPGSNASHLNLAGWDMVVLPDSSVDNRPDPVTGQIPTATITPWNVDLRNGANAVTVAPITGSPKYFVLGFANPDPSSETTTPAVTLDANSLPTVSTARTHGSTLIPIVPYVGPTTPARYYWLYLRRPANPFDTTSTVKEMVVVDSIRFPYVDAGGEGEVDMMSGNDKLKTQGTRNVWAPNRFQPYRGGQILPSGGTQPIPSTALGYSEQLQPSTGKTTTLRWGTVTTPYLTIQHGIGVGGTIGTTADAWSYFPFFDRDFMSPAELLMVPGCPPGLFTKQFVEHAYKGPSDARGSGWSDSRLTTTMTRPTGSDEGDPLNTTADTSPPVFPYLPDQFYYTAASVAPFDTTVAYPSKTGGWTGAGWYKMFEFLETPSSANGSIGAVTEGANFDWRRQDRKPGQLNLNLIVDEEVFLGLMDDPRLNALLVNALETTQPLMPHVVSQIDMFGYPIYRSALTPSTANPYFRGAYPISTLQTYQAYDPNPMNANAPLQYDAVPPYTISAPLLQGRGAGVLRAVPAGGAKYYYSQGLKAAFSDFLKLRHGGSGFMFAWGGGATGQGNFDSTPPVSPNTTGPVAAERPFRSPAFPDINYTVMRPATLPPSTFTNPSFPEGKDLNGNDRSWTQQVGSIMPPPPYPLRVYQYADNTGALITPIPQEFIGDPGVKNPYVEDPVSNLNKKLVPLIPPRRLFQIPDKSNTGTPPSNAAAFDDPTVNANVNQPTISTALSNSGSTQQMLSTIAPTLVNNTALGTLDPKITQNVPAPPTSWLLGSGGTGDRREHPYFRTEWLQKVMNLTTVRTHQFAVWITIGFFEVVQPGAPSLAVPDKLGAELGQASGRALRYRSFFILDRTRAVGFNSGAPIDFRDVVTYRRRIE